MDKRLKHLNALRCFESAARHKSYSKAAQELFVSQAAVSQQMRLLEDVLEIKLFMRSGRNMQLTQSGEKLYQSTHQALMLLIKGLNSIQTEGLAGDLTITSTQSFCSLWIMPRLFRFAQLYPDINIKILGSNHVEDIQVEHIDIAIRFSTKDRMKMDEQLTYEQFGEVPVYPVCSPNLLNHMQLNTPQDLLKCSLVSFANETIVTWKDWFKHAGVEGYELHSQKTEVTSSDMALSAVLSGHGAMLSASSFLTPYLQSKQLIVPFKIRHPVKWQQYIVFDPNSARLKRIGVFVDWVKAEMKNAQSTLEIDGLSAL
jgi:LysR family glycine cleavage system transcriptional activator